MLYMLNLQGLQIYQQFYLSVSAWQIISLQKYNKVWSTVNWKLLVKLLIFNRFEATRINIMTPDITLILNI